MDCEQHARAHLRKLTQRDVESKTRREKKGESPWTLKMVFKVRQRKEAKEMEQERECMYACGWARKRQKKRDLMRLDLVLKVLQCFDKTFMS